MSVLPLALKEIFVSEYHWLFFITFSRQVEFSLNCPPLSLMNTTLNIKGKEWLYFIRFSLLHYSILLVLRDSTNLYQLLLTSLPWIIPQTSSLFHWFIFEINYKLFYIDPSTQEESRTFHLTKSQALHQTLVPLWCICTWSKKLHLAHSWKN